MSNYLLDAMHSIGTSSGSYQFPVGSFSDFDSSGLEYGDVFLIFFSGVILLKILSDYNNNKSSPSSLPTNK